jgi:hypothetical protein
VHRRTPAAKSNTSQNSHRVVSSHFIFLSGACREYGELLKSRAVLERRGEQRRLSFVHFHFNMRIFLAPVKPSCIKA